MDYFAHEVLFQCLRGAAAAFGAGSFAALNRAPNWRASLLTMFPGFAFGLFASPLICDVLVVQMGWPQLELPHADLGMTMLSGLLGNTCCRGLLFGAENWAPEWVRMKIRQLLGLPEPPLPPPAAYVKPKSEPPIA